MKTLIRGAIAALLLGSACLSAQAADLAPRVAPVTVAPLDTSSPWLFRLRAIGVVTDSSISVVGTTLQGKATDTVVPELDISYFFTKNIAAELILAASPHSLKLTSPPALNGLGLAHTVLLPPTLTFQYHFTNFGQFQPYVGAGVNYTWFLGQTGTNLNSIAIRSKAAPAFQIGADYFIDQHWGLNIDLKKLLLRTNYTGNASNALGVPFIFGSARLDPWIIGAGVSYRF